LGNMGGMRREGRCGLEGREGNKGGEEHCLER
jgi:hypothetical protein